MSTINCNFQLNFKFFLITFRGCVNIVFAKIAGGNFNWDMLAAFFVWNLPASQAKLLKQPASYAFLVQVFCFTGVLVLLPISPRFPHFSLFLSYFIHWSLSFIMFSCYKTLTIPLDISCDSFSLSFTLFWSYHLFKEVSSLRWDVEAFISGFLID